MKIIDHEQTEKESGSTIYTFYFDIIEDSHALKQEMADLQRQYGKIRHIDTKREDYSYYKYYDTFDKFMDEFSDKDFEETSSYSFIGAENDISFSISKDLKKINVLDFHRKVKHVAPKYYVFDDGFVIMYKDSFFYYRDHEAKEWILDDSLIDMIYEPFGKY